MSPAAPFTIGIDARTYFFRAGLGRYCRRLVEAWMGSGGDTRLVLWLSGHKTVADFPAAADDRLELRIAPAAHGDLTAESTMFCDEINADHLDVFFSPFAPPPARLRCPTVLTVHDLTPLTHPGLHLPATVKYFTQTIDAALGRVDRLVADSRASALAIANRWPLAFDRTAVIPLGVDARFGERDRGSVEATLRPFGLVHHAYVLYVGSIEPRKNLVRAIDAYAGSTIRGKWPFVIAGSQRWGSNAVLDRASAPDVSGHVRFIDFVSENNLPALYAGARFFVYPSLAEGFGLPVLEAMACGTPVMTSDVSSLPEVSGDAALLVPPEDTAALCDAMNRLADDAALRATLAARGLAQARAFSWERTASATMRVLLAAAGRSAT